MLEYLYTGEAPAALREGSCERFTTRRCGGNEDGDNSDEECEEEVGGDGSLDDDHGGGLASRRRRRARDSRNSLGMPALSPESSRYGLGLELLECADE